MSVERNKALYRRWIDEVWTRGDFRHLDDFHHPDSLNHDFAPGTPPGPEGVRAVVTRIRTAFPDHVFTVEDVIGEGDKVVGSWTGRGTHLGEWRSRRGTFPPTGRPVVWRGIDILTIREGKIAELRDIETWLELVEQLRA